MKVYLSDANSGYIKTQRVKGQGISLQTPIGTPSKDTVTITPEAKAKIENAKKRASEVLALSKTVFEDGSKQYQEVSAIINAASANGFKNDDTKGITFEDIHGYKVLEEKENGKIKRRTEIDPDTLKPRAIYENYQATSDDAYSASKLYYYSEEGALEDAKKNVVQTKDTRSADEKMFFYKGQLTSYVKDFKDLNPKDSTSAEEISFDEGKLASYAQNCSQSFTYTYKDGEVIDFEDGKAKTLQTDRVMTNDGETTSAQKLELS